jgi:CubicO group peptidase (beta-lactamase class C family)
VNQPGKEFQYGVGLDWAGILVERVMKMTLDEYIQKNILQPLSLQNVTFLPSSAMISRLAYMHQREADGKLYQSDHVYRRPLVARTDREKQSIFHMGGAGCFANIEEYCRK